MGLVVVGAHQGLEQFQHLRLHVALGKVGVQARAGSHGQRLVIRGG